MDKLNEEIARKKREREEARAGSTLNTDGKYVKMGIASKTVAAAAALPESKVSLQSSESSSNLAVKAKPKTRKVLVYANRVTFTVQRDVASLRLPMTQKTHICALCSVNGEKRHKHPNMMTQKPNG